MAGPVLADPGQLHQIIMNLGTNALHAMEERGGTLTLSPWKTPPSPATSLVSSPGDYIRLAVGRHWLRYLPGNPRAHLRPLFHHQGGGQGDRHGPGHCPWHRESYGGSISCDQRPEGVRCSPSCCHEPPQTGPVKRNGAHNAYRQGAHPAHRRRGDPGGNGQALC
jgi:hypothetical protein